MTIKTWKAWTKAEDDLLRLHWHSGEPTKSWINQFGDRSIGAVLQHGKELGLGKRHNLRRPLFSPVWEGIKAELRKGEMLSANEIAARIKVSPRNVMLRLAEHHGTEVHIGGWTRTGTKSPARLWALGIGRDAPKPKPADKRKLNREYAREKRKDPEWVMVDNMKRRRRHAEQSGRLIRRDPAASWIPARPAVESHHPTANAP